MQDKKKIYSMLDIAKELGLTKQSIHLYFKAGKLGKPDMQVGQVFLWTARRAEAFINRKKKARGSESEA